MRGSLPTHLLHRLPHPAASPPGPQGSQLLSLPCVEPGGFWGEKPYVAECAFLGGPRLCTFSTVEITWGPWGWAGCMFEGCGRYSQPEHRSLSPPPEAKGESHPVRCPQASRKGSPAAAPGGGPRVSSPPPTPWPSWPLLTAFTRTALLQFAKHFSRGL